MNVRHRIARRLGMGVAGFWLLSAAAIGGTVLLGGCNKIDDLTSSDDNGGGSKNLTVQPAASTVAPKNTLGVTATASDSNGAPAKDGTPIAFTVDVGSIAPAVALTTAGKATATFTAGAKEGTAKITATAFGASQTESVQVKAGAPTATGDEFPYGIQNILWDNRGTNLPVHTWPVTAKITSAYHRGEELRIFNNCTEKWPHVQKEGWSKPSVGNYWLIGKINGRWHAATVDWAGINKSGMNDLYLNGNSGMYSDLINWRPVKGEEAYVMMSTHARAYVDPRNKQRTQIVRITMNP
jgi:hypothetical protein